MIPAEKVIVAVDVSEKSEALSLMKTLEGHPVWVKIGMELFYSAGPDIVHEAKSRGLNVFLDLKLHDIPNTVGQGLKSLTKLPIDMVNIHAAGGSEMMKRASEAVKSHSNCLLIAVTQLTSTSESQMNAEQRIAGSILESVTHYSLLAKLAGCDGVVSSPHEVKSIKNNCGNNFITVTPGIRPMSSSKDDQIRITTPLEALELGTDFMVIGRPITKALDPRAALESILKGN